MKWAVINSLPLTSFEDPSLKVWISPFSPFLLHIHFQASFFQILFFGMLQTFLIQVTILVRGSNASSFTMNSFCFSPPFKDLLQKGINVLQEDVFYNWTNMSSMSIFKTWKPFWTTKEFHPLTLKPSLRCVWKHDLLLLTCMYP
jgi:hypothetical protein